jgi:hypothetical protein
VLGEARAVVGLGREQVDARELGAAAAVADLDRAAVRGGAKPAAHGGAQPVWQIGERHLVETLDLGLGSGRGHRPSHRRAAAEECFAGHVDARAVGVVAEEGARGG